MPAVPVVETRDDLVVFAIPADHPQHSDEHLLNEGWWNLFAYLARCRFSEGLYRNAAPPHDIEFTILRSAKDLEEHGFRHLCPKCKHDIMELHTMFVSGATNAAVLCEYRTQETTYVETVPQRADDAESA